MFIIIADSVATKIVLALLALIFEVTKLSDLQRLQIKNKMRTVYVFSYSLKAILSVVASVGLILTVISAQNSVIEIKTEFVNTSLATSNHDVAYWKQELFKLDETISLLNENLDRNPKGYGLSGRTFVNEIKGLKALKEKYYINYQLSEESLLNKLSQASQATAEINPTDMFIELGEISNVDPNILKTLIFILIMVLIEVSLFLTGIKQVKSVNETMTQNDLITDKVIKSRKTQNPKSLKKDFRPDLSKSKLTVINQLKNTSAKGFSTAKEITRLQTLQENKGLCHLTQAKLATVLETTPVIINNVVRRYINPIMKKLEIKSYLDLGRFLSKI